MRFKEKVAIVTGAGQGIGLEMCRRLSKEGAFIVLNDLDPELASNAADVITNEKGTCIPISGDSSNPVLIQTMVDTAVAHFGKLDITIANAGITLYGDFFSYTPEAFQRVMQVNLAGSFFLVQAAATQMKQQGTGGSLLLTSSVTGHQAHKNLAAYGMSKAALEMLARNLVIELAPYRININTVAPGATITERTTEDPDYVKVWSGITPMGRPATVTDIANAALFLVSDEARHVNGQTLIIDGGWTCVSPQP